jgi:hypothetical protein
LNSFLPSPSRREAVTGVVSSPAAVPAALPVAPQQRPGAPFAFSDSQRAVLGDLQYSLRKHGIDAEMDEIGKGILEALAARPSLCRGLLAAYLLDL